MASAAPEIPALARDRAFEALYRRHVADVYRYALALLRNPADAEDVTQTTFLNAYRALKRGEEVAKPHHWLIKIAHNVARSRHAREGRRVKEVPLDDHVDRLAIPDVQKPDVRIVLDALGRLPLNQRAALVMRELEGRTYGEISETLGVSVPAVETLIFRARRSLRLKASAIRALALVPVPPSLAGLLDAGAIVGGGGAAAGAGLLGKVLLALLVGVAAGTLGPERGDRAVAARPASPSAAALAPGTALLDRPVLLSRTDRRPRRAARTVVPAGRSAPLVRPGAVRTAPARSGPAAGPSAPTSGTVAADPLPAVVAPTPATALGSTGASTVDSAVATVTSTVSGAASTVSAAAPTAPGLPAPPQVPLPLLP
jgi:RNA polymerase sigma factor (sigma-70 family)